MLLEIDKESLEEHVLVSDNVNLHGQFTDLQSDHINLQSDFNGDYVNINGDQLNLQGDLLPEDLQYSVVECGSEAFFNYSIPTTASDTDTTNLYTCSNSSTTETDPTLLYRVTSPWDESFSSPSPPISSPPYSPSSSFSSSFSSSPSLSTTSSPTSVIVRRVDIESLVDQCFLEEVIEKV